MENVISPLLRWLILPSPPTTAGSDADGETDSDSVDSDVHVHIQYALGSALDMTLFWLYQVAWIYPVYGISFLFNSVWYQDIAEHAFLLYDTYAHNGQSPRIHTVSPPTDR